MFTMSISDKLHTDSTLTAVSVTRTLLELNRLEQMESQKRLHDGTDEEPVDSTNGLTAPSWISEGLDLEFQQYVCPQR